MHLVLPLDCIRYIWEMALDKDDYWTISEFIHVCADLRGLCKPFAETLSWNLISKLLSVPDIQTSHHKETPMTYTKTQAKSTFSLTDNDLEDLPCTRKKNPRFPSSAPMKLYSSKVLLQKAREKYGTKRIMLEYEEKKRQISIKRLETIKKAQTQRQEELETKLRERGLHLRSDSRLCKLYIENGNGNLDKIVNIMHEMDFYHQYTEYRVLYREIWSAEKAYKGWCDPDSILEEAKSAALYEFARKRNDCPDFVPPTLRPYVYRIQEEEQHNKQQHQTTRRKVARPYFSDIFEC